MRLDGLRAMLLLLACVAWVGCEQAPEPQLEPADPAPATAPSAPAPAPVPAVTAARGIAEHQRLAEQGDIRSMMILGRSHESVGNRNEARKWYKLAAEAGSSQAKESLANLDAPSPAPVAASPATVPSASTAPPAAAPPPAATAPSGPVDPSKLRWQDVLATLDTTDFVTAEKPDVKGRFVAITTARDGTITVAASGPTGDHIEEVIVVIRVRRQDVASSPRVAQTGAIAARVTLDNVTHAEWLGWVEQYLATERSSAPVFRNGWRIIVSGAAADGIKVKKEHLGPAVRLEMRK